MSALVIDTSSWIAYFAGKPLPLVKEGLAEGRVYLPPVVAVELTSGQLPEKKRQALVELLEDLPLCTTDLDHWLRVGSLRSHLRQKGLSVSTPDAHVAQCVLDLHGILMSEDRIFQKISTLVPALRLTSSFQLL